MAERLSILVASTPEGQYIAQHALSLTYNLKFASTLREAQFVLNESDHTGFDLIIAGIHFDDSQMFEFLQYVRSVDELREIPFVVIQAQNSAIDLMDKIRSSAKNFNASGFLQLQNMNVEAAAKLLRTAVEEVLK